MTLQVHSRSLDLGFRAHDLRLRAWVLGLWVWGSRIWGVELRFGRYPTIDRHGTLSVGVAKRKGADIAKRFVALVFAEKRAWRWLLRSISPSVAGHYDQSILHAPLITPPGP